MKLGIIDDHPFILQAYKNTLCKYEIVLTASNGKDLIENLQNLEKQKLPELLILDLNMPIMNGYDAVIWIKKNYPNIKIAIATMSSLESDVIRLIKAGVDGYIFKQDLTLEELQKLVLQIKETGTYYPERIAKILAKSVQQKIAEKNDDEVKLELLSVKEQQILKHIAKEFTSSEIAFKLNVTIRTIENHKQNIFSKLEVRTTIGAVLFAQRMGLLSD